MFIVGGPIDPLSPAAPICLASVIPPKLRQLQAPSPLPPAPSSCCTRHFQVPCRLLALPRLLCCRARRSQSSLLSSLLSGPYSSLNPLRVTRKVRTCCAERRRLVAIEYCKKHGMVAISFPPAPFRNSPSSASPHSSMFASANALMSLCTCWPISPHGDDDMASGWKKVVVRNSRGMLRDIY